MFSLRTVLKATIGGFLILLYLNQAIYAQNCPAQGTEIYPELSGQNLLDALIQAYKTTSVLNYDTARETLYGNIDNKSGKVEGVYTGYVANIEPAAGNIRGQAVNTNINAEHSWPQSKGASDGTLAHSDMHHLYPAYSSANSSRGNSPFYEIPDDETDGWWLRGQQYTTPSAYSIDFYSERRDNHPNANYSGSWEPRESVEGNIARSMFYFYTIYKDQADAADPIFFEIQKQFLRTWNQLDPVSTREYDRTCAIAEFQDGKVNPFVIDPTLVERAYFEGNINQTNVFFSASELTINEGQKTLQIEVSITNPNPDTATSVQMVYEGGTATPGDDFEIFNSNQTISFAKGTLERQAVSINLIDDDLEENEETIILKLQSPSGPNNVQISSPQTIEISITDNDGEIPTRAWINELHYDNTGADEGEFVELAVNAEFADLSTVSLTLYNGSNSSVYASFSGNDFLKGESQSGYSFYYLDLPSNGIQNGAPDGLSLDIDGELIQFLSYEGTMTAADGPASGLESTEVGVVQTGSSPVGSSLSLADTGNTYHDFMWEFTEVHSKGSVNANQHIKVDPIPFEPVMVQFTESAISLFEDEETAILSLSISNPNPDTATSVQISQIGGTASEGEDFEAFETQSVTFDAGSSENQSFDISIYDDEFYEKNETLILAINTISGPKSAQIGSQDTIRIRIVNDDVNDGNSRFIWINEINYQNTDSDSSDFVEFVVVGIPTKLQSGYLDPFTLTLYNASTGQAYANFTGDEIQEAEQVLDEDGGFAIFGFVDVSDLQNRNPGGVSLSTDNDFIQFLSYGGSFAAKDGPAKDHQSEDIGILGPEEVTSSFSLSLKGSGYQYFDYSWAVSDSSTKGHVNKAQYFDLPSSNEEATEITSDYKLNQNYPNPFNPSTVISYQLAKNATVRLQVFDMLGREVATLLNSERKTAGSHQITFDAGNLSSGVYIYRLSTSSGIQLTRKMLLMK
ncbi:MAG: Calx-beta domain-containing protein [Gracilimonas sp.]|nr:Calx-beta domain-containing protein [Gracilimonas sp.]